MAVAGIAVLPGSGDVVELVRIVTAKGTSWLDEAIPIAVGRRPFAARLRVIARRGGGGSGSEPSGGRHFVVWKMSGARMAGRVRGARGATSDGYAAKI